MKKTQDSEKANKYVSVWGAHNRKRIYKTFTQPSMTVQDAKDECDINYIWRTYTKTGVLGDPARAMAAQYMDIPEGFPTDFQQAHNFMIKAQDDFESLPATTREYFKNNPLNFLNAVQDPNQYDNLVQLGLATKREEVPSKEPEVPPPAPNKAPKKSSEKTEE